MLVHLNVTHAVDVVVGIVSSYILDDIRQVSTTENSRLSVGIGVYVLVLCHLLKESCSAERDAIEARFLLLWPATC